MIRRRRRGRFCAAAAAAHSIYHPCCASQAVLAWYRGSRFAEVLKMADVFEGSMVRAIRRLEELLRQLAQACDAVGDVALAERLRACNEHIKRDIVFAASLYL